MLKKLRFCQFVYLTSFSSLLLTGCGDKDKDAKPKEHVVEVKFQASAVPSNFLVNFYVEEDEGKGATTTFLVAETPSNGTMAETHTAELATSTNESIEAYISLSPVSGSSAIVPATTVKADIVVDGAVKHTITINKDTPVTSSGLREVSALHKL
ncbi:hypothetical protein KBK19_07440 [Microvirga sp. STR05]|uniref:Lipoprotein n=1 Tax=Hymenobacter duratus TaxID=2771356 RepID=A0ABR8JDF0_9BACT|nr:hypothetical protein [Hymenobacter duratus]MBD2714862.1 hypothetical protein [Hymenobacter duratus]MBR7949768.1 hypothetical protein [Microvirga sp. STR05]